MSKFTINNTVVASTDSQSHDDDDGSNSNRQDITCSLAAMITDEQLASFKQDGYLVIHDLLAPDEVVNLKRWTQEVHGWKPTATSEFMPYEETNAHGEKVLRSTENYVDSHAGLDGLLRSEKLLSVLEQLAGEKMLLFKEKINYEPAGSGGFAPLIDAVAYTHVKDVKHLTVLLAVDESNSQNGGLDVVSGSHGADIPVNEKDGCIEPSWVSSQDWEPVELEAGQLVIFGSYLAHRSGANHSDKDRKVIHATYNCASEGDMHKSYYEDMKRLPVAGDAYVQGGC